MPISPFILFTLTDKSLKIFPSLQNIRAVQYFLENPSEYLSIVSILATVMIAVMIYQMQKSNETRQREKEQQHARGVLFDSVLLGIQQVQRYAKVHLHEDHFGQGVKAVRITERHFEALNNVPKDIITQEDIQTFHFLLSDLEKLNNYEVEEARYEIYYAAKKLMRKLFIPAYYIYREETAEPMNMIDFLLPNYRNVFLKMGYSSKEHYYIDQNNKPILRLHEDDTWDVFDVDGVQVAESIVVDTNGIKKGYGTLNDSHEGIKYIGYWQNYKQHGQGKEYVHDYFSKEEVLDKSGIWKAGEFQQGTLYHRLIHKVFKEKEQLPQDAMITKLESRGNVYTDQIVHLSYEHETYTVDKHVMDYKEHQYVIAKREKDDAEGTPSLVDYLAFDQVLFEGIVYRDIEVKGKQSPITQCPEGVTQEEVNQYNQILNKIPRKIKQYNKESEMYERIQENGKEITLSFTNKGSMDIDCFEVEIISPPGLLVVKGTKSTEKKPLLPREFKYAPVKFVKESLPIQYLFEYLKEKKDAVKNNDGNIPEVYEDLDDEVDDENNHSASVIKISNKEHLEPGQSTKNNQTFIITPLASGEYFIKFNYIIGDDYPSSYTDYFRVVVQAA